MNKLNVEVLPPTNTHNAIPLNINAYKQLSVYSSSGKLVTLDVRHEKIFFEAYWCPHCQRTLVLWNQNRKYIGKSPLIVSTGFKPGTTLKEAMDLSNKEFQAFSISDTNVYYLLGSAKKILPLGIPALVFYDHNQTEMLVGEHTLTIWKSILKS